MEFDTNMNVLENLNDDKRGFSTIELIMALVIAGIMAAVALPRLASVSQIDLYSAARQAKSDIRYTQELAMSKYAIRKIVFTGDGDTYYIKDSLDNIIESRKLPEDSNVIFDSSSQSSFEFNSAGEPITGGGSTLILKFPSGGPTIAEQIDVSNITGMTDIP